MKIPPLIYSVGYIFHAPKISRSLLLRSVVSQGQFRGHSVAFTCLIFATENYD